MPFQNYFFNQQYAYFENTFDIFFYSNVSMQHIVLVANVNSLMAEKRFYLLSFNLALLIYRKYHRATEGGFGKKLKSVSMTFIAVSTHPNSLQKMCNSTPISELETKFKWWTIVSRTTYSLYAVVSWEDLEKNLGCWLCDIAGYVT